MAIRRRLAVIIVVFLTVAVITGVLTFLWWTYMPGYTATARLTVSPPAKEYFNDRSNLVRDEAIDRYKRGLAGLVKFEPVLDNAITKDKQQRILDTQWYDENRASVLEELGDMVTVKLVPETDIIELSASGANQGELADIVNAVADAFIEYASRGPKRQLEDEIKKLDAREKDRLKLLETKRNDISTRLAGSALAGWEGRANELSIKRQMYLKDHNLAEQELQIAMTALAAWERGGDDHSNDPRVRQMVDMDTRIRQLEAEESSLSSQLENALRKFGPEHRQVKDLEQLLSSVSLQLEQRTQEIIQQSAAAIDQQLKLAAEEAKIRVADLQDKLLELQSEARDVQRTIGQVDALRQEVQDLDSELKMIREKKLEFTLLREEGEGTSGPVEMQAAAMPPKQRSSPSIPVNIALGCFLGLAIGFGLAFLLEFGKTSVRSPSDISRKIDLPMLGMVPHADDLDEEVDDFRRVAIQAPRSLAAEAFRQIRTNLLFSGPASQRRTLLVTSPAPEDGRTTVVMNLAASMAQAGRKVLVLDANFRQPAIGSMFPEATQAGLSSVLVDQANWREVVSPTGMANCDVVAAGPLPPNPAELLGSEKMREILGEMAGEYDQVLLDGAPVLVVSDSLVLGTQVDGVVLVVRAGQNTVGVVQKSTEQLRRIGSHILGAVLQGVRTTAGGYLRKNYETFYEYHQKALP
jgi:capsular exopolysaccharide synthesis family protein